MTQITSIVLCSPRARHPGMQSYVVLGNITTNKASGGDGIPAELFHILKDVAPKVLHKYAIKFGKLNSGHRTGKGWFSFQSQRKAIPKNAQTTTQLLSCHMLKSNARNAPS